MGGKPADDEDEFREALENEIEQAKQLYWHILAGVRVFGSLSDYDTLSLRYHNPIGP